MGLRITEIPWKTAADLSFDKSAVTSSLKSQIRDIVDLDKIKDVASHAASDIPEGYVPLSMSNVDFGGAHAGIFHRFIDKLFRRHSIPKFDAEGVDLKGPLAGNYFVD